MIPELGHFALVLAFVVALAQAALPVIGAVGGAARNDEALLRFALPAAIVQALLISLAFLSLIAAALMDDFSVASVAENSHTLKPLLYKVAGTWGAHEGSLVLWVLILALFGAAVAVLGRMPLDLKARALSVQAMISSGFLAFILFTSNPFLRIFPPPANGNDLNPILQDPGLAFHPPCLYLGYVGFSIVFSFAVAALWQGRCDRDWARYVRPWAAAAWSALTLGIFMGSWWAYYTLGWGGWWFWDPVENASLMPWLAGTALLHSLVVLEKRNALKSWTLLLSIVTFSLSLLGTFLVRSGVLASVHSFANDPARGVVVLALLVGYTGAAFTLYAIRARSLKLGGLFLPISREGGIVINNLLLATAAATVFTGTLYPLFLNESEGHTVSIGPPYFNKTFIPLMAPATALMAIGPFLAWKRGDLPAALQRLKVALVVALMALALAFWLHGAKPVLAPFGLALAAWIVTGALAEPVTHMHLGQVPLRTALARLKAWPLANWSRVLAHAGMGFAIAGMVGSGLWKGELIALVHKGETLHLAGYDIRFDGAQDVAGPNYTASEGSFAIARYGMQLGVLHPQRRFYPTQRRFTTDAAIRTDLAADLYVTLGEVDRADPTAYVTRIYHHPLVPWIWLGGVMMATGGGLSLLARSRPWRISRA